MVNLRLSYSNLKAKIKLRGGWEPPLWIRHWGSVRLECQSRDGLYTVGGADAVVGGLQCSSSAATTTSIPELAGGHNHSSNALLWEGCGRLTRGWHGACANIAIDGVRTWWPWRANVIAGGTIAGHEWGRCANMAAGAPRRYGFGGVLQCSGYWCHNVPRHKCWWCSDGAAFSWCQDDCLG
jgi:hypothetical protein